MHTVRDRAADVLHGVVDRQASRHDAARAVDIERNVLARVLRLQEQQLGADQRADLVVDRAGEEDDPLLQQAGIDVESALAAGGLLHHHRHQVVAIDLDGIAILHGCHLQVGVSRIDKWNRTGLQLARRPVVGPRSSARRCHVAWPAVAWPAWPGHPRLPGSRLRAVGGRAVRPCTAAGLDRIRDPPGGRPPAPWPAPPAVTVFSSTLASSSMKSTTFSSNSGPRRRLGGPRILPEELEHLLLLARIARRLGPHRPGHLVRRHRDAVHPADLRQQQAEPHPPLRDGAVIGLQRLLVLVLVVLVQPALPCGPPRGAARSGRTPAPPCPRARRSWPRRPARPAAGASAAAGTAGRIPPGSAG